MKEQRWLTVDEATDVIGSLRHCVVCRKYAVTDELAWKWYMLALHSSLQGACISHLTTTAAPIGALTKKSTEQWLAWLQSDRNDASPETRLLDLPELLKKVRKVNCAGNRGDHDTIRISDSELQWISYFHGAIRNQFVHFAPMGWSIELSGLPGLSKLSIRIIKGIKAAGWGFRHLSFADATELDKLLLQLSEGWTN